MCVAAGYNEGCHITTAFPTQGRLKMITQHAKRYITLLEATGAIFKMAEDGWFVHSMVGGMITTMGDMGILVVYRKDED